MSISDCSSDGCTSDLLDIRMPDMDGIAVQQRLVAGGIAIPVIVLTGHADVSIAVQAMKAGAVDLLEKPFGKAALIASIEAAFDRMTTTNGAAVRAARANRLLDVLTRREREVLDRSEEHTSELQSLMRISYAVFCLKKKNQT